MSFAYYDTDADIAWFPTGDSDDVVSECVPGGLRDYDRATRQLVAIEVWDASTRLPATCSKCFPRLSRRTASPPERPATLPSSLGHWRSFSASRHFRNS